MIIYVATIEHKYGTNSYYAKSEKGLFNLIHGYVVENWDDSEPIPDAANDAVDQYFDDKLGDESLEYLDPIDTDEIAD